MYNALSSNLCKLLEESATTKDQLDQEIIPASNVQKKNKTK